MRPESQALLEDARSARELIQGFVASKSYEDYGLDPLLLSAVERQFEIAG